MRRKFPNAAAGRSALLEKRLSRGGQKFFDSGDYNLAKAATDPRHKHKVSNQLQKISHYGDKYRFHFHCCHHHYVQLLY